MINIIKTKDLIEHELWHWTEDFTRVLFITGLGGSGKTSLAKNYAELLGAKYVGLDQYFKQLIRTNTGEENPDYERHAFENGVQWLLADNPTGRIVIEGAQVRWLDPNQVMSHSYMLLRDSLVTSTWRACKRDFTKEHWAKWKRVVPHKHLWWNLKAFNQMKAFYSCFPDPS